MSSDGFFSYVYPTVDSLDELTVTTSAGSADASGQGAALATSASSPYYGGIDFSQSIGTVPAGFSMQYVDCSTNGRQTTYDVRWNVMSVTANSTRLITASARQRGSTSDGLHYSIPVTLRAVGGS